MTGRTLSRPVGLRPRNVLRDYQSDAIAAALAAL